MGGVAALACALIATVPHRQRGVASRSGMAELCDATPHHGCPTGLLSLAPRERIRADLAELESLVTPAPAPSSINSPSNPIGSVWSEKTVQAWYDFALRRDLGLVSDEVYESIIFDGRHVSPAALAPPRRRSSASSAFPKPTR